MISKKWKWMLALALVLVVVFNVGLAAGAATSSADPGSTGDPLITKSYLDQALSEAGGTTKTSSYEDLADDVASMQKLLDTMKNSDEPDLSYQKVTLASGKTLTANGGTELLLYTGSVVLKSSSQTAVVDVTDGKCLTNGKSLTLYHSYLFAKKSSITAKSTATIYVKGNYSVK